MSYTIGLKVSAVLTSFIIIHSTLLAQTGNIGIGISDPTQKLSVDGAIQIGMSADNETIGTIRWNPETGDFEGYTGAEWKSLTARETERWGVTTHTESARVIPGDDDSGDQFGWSVATDGDYTIIGAYGDDEAEFDAGAAYIFQRSGNTWTEVQKLTAADADLVDWFGYSVSISGDYAVIGAPYDDASGSNAGAAYIFVRTGNTWSQQAKLTAPDGSNNDYFGVSVDISGIYCIIGASEHGDDMLDGSGAAYIFRRSLAIWFLHDKLTASDPEMDDNFGLSVAIDGDYCVVGSYLDDDNGSNSGSCYIFHRIGNSWTEQDKLTASDGEQSDRFGVDVDISGDRIAVGAYYTDHSGDNCGTAYVFDRAGDQWTEAQILVAKDASADDWFGFRVSIHGTDIVVSAVGYGPDESSYAQGCAYVFRRSGTIWQQYSKLMAQSGEGQDELGRSVSLSGQAAVIGAPGEGIAGGVYFFHVDQ